MKFIFNLPIILLLSSILYTNEIGAKEKFKPEYDYTINRNYLFQDCEEKKKCYESCNNIPNYAMFFSIFTNSVDSDISKKIKLSCLSECSRTICYKNFK